MYHIFWKRTGSESLPRLELEGVWRVDADSSYQIRPAKSWPHSTVIAIRTEKGMGSLQAGDSTRYSLPENSLVFLRAREIREYFTQSSPWKFYWFEFREDPGYPLPLGEILSIPFSASEKELIRECYLNLGSAGRESGLLSQVCFLRLVLSWLDSGSRTGSDRNLIAILERGGRKNLSIPQIAREAGMCERSFRSEIHRLTGCSPGEYLTGIRMDTAMEMLCSTDLTLQEISDSLGYCNVFYFSRVFRQFFGIAPGCARKNFSK